MSVAVPPVVGSVRGLMVKAETRGRESARASVLDNQTKHHYEEPK